MMNVLATPVEVVIDGEPMQRLLTRQEVADLCQVHVRTVDAWLARGRLRCVRLGSLVRVRRCDLEMMLNGVAVVS